MTGLPLPLPTAFVFTANVGNEIDRYPEGDLNWVARHRIWSLLMEMSDGESLTVQPTLAPPHLRKRFPWLRGIRFYDVFFPASQEPRLITSI
jgi:hypothetical protein